MSSGAAPSRPVLEVIADRRWLVLSGWAVVCAIAHAGAYGFGWHYFVTGSRVLTGGHGLHLYSTHDELQSGPLSFLATAPLVEVLPTRAAEGAAMVIMTAAGVLLAWVIEQAQEPGASGRAHLRSLVVGVLVVGAWSEVAVHWAHPDDVLALLGVFAALVLFRREQAVVAALLLALAVDAKPWALLFAPMLLLAAPRRRLPAAAAYAAVLAVAWVPFVVADPSSVHAGSFRIPVSPASVLHLVGIDGGTPSWCRPAQIVLGAGLVWLALHRGRWYAVPLVGICARMLLDPATKNYYDSGLIAAAGLFDLLAGAGTVPLMTLAAAVLVYVPSYALTDVPTLRAVLRAAFLLIAPAVALVLPVRPRTVAPAAR